MFLIDDVIMAVKGGKLAAMATGVAITVAVGFGAGVAWEHRPKQGFPLAILGQGLKTQMETLRDSIPAKVAAAHRAGAQAQGAADKEAFGKWDSALNACRGQLRTARDNAESSITAAEALTRAQTRQAYNMGRATCGAGNAPNSPSAGGPAGASPGGVRVPESDDFGAIFNPGAFTPTR